jgi:hypothetical protein
MSIHTSKHAQVKLSTGKGRRRRVNKYGNIGPSICHIIYQICHKICYDAIILLNMPTYSKIQIAWSSINTKKKNSNLNRQHVDTQNRHPPIEFLTGGKCAATI